MNYELIIRPEAESDIDDSFNWYEDQNEGLGKYFLLNVEAALFAIDRNPNAFQVIHGQIRRAMLRRFPHSIFFFVTENRIVVTACIHHKRRPQISNERI